MNEYSLAKVQYTYYTYSRTFPVCGLFSYF